MKEQQATELLETVEEIEEELSGERNADALDALARELQRILAGSAETLGLLAPSVG